MNEHYKTVEGWFDFPELYDHMVEQAKDGDTFVEIGVFKGKSLCYLYSKIQESGKKITLYGVDKFKPFLCGLTNKKTGERFEEMVTPTIDEARSNLVKSGASESEAWAMLIPDSSLKARRRFADASLQFVFLDDDHGYESVKANIRAWLPKIKPGGFIGGHDFEEGWPSVVDGVTRMFPGIKAVFGKCWLVKVKG